MNVDLMNGINVTNTFNSYGGTNQNKGEPKLKEDLTNLLVQERGKFYPDPEFGSRLQQFLFMPLTEETGQLVKQDVYETISKYYPQITIKYINVSLANKTISITVGYTYSDSQNPSELDLTVFNQI